MRHPLHHPRVRAPNLRAAGSLHHPRRLAKSLLCAALMLCATGAAIADDAVERSFQPLANEPAPRQTWFFRWEECGRSIDGRPIECMQIGHGPFRTLVLGSVHGSESSAVNAVEQLARHLGRMSDHWHAINVLVVKTPNPDGFARGSNGNARGVDLNHNFPAKSVLPVSRSAKDGATAFSELETRAIRDVISRYRPHRVVHVKSTRNATGWVLCSGHAGAAADYFKEFDNLRNGRLEQHLVTGSLEGFCIETLRLETVTLAVPNSGDADAVWQEYRNPLLAAAAYVDPQWRKPTRDEWEPVQSWPRDSVAER